MRYQSTNPRAATNPLRSIPLFKPASAVFGEAWFTGAAPADVQHEQTLALLRHRLLSARDEAGEAFLVYEDAKAEVGIMNRRSRRDRHDRALFNDRQLARLRRDVFVTMNRYRGRLNRALKALAAAEAALAAAMH